MPTDLEEYLWKEIYDREWIVPMGNRGRIDPYASMECGAKNWLACIQHAMCTERNWKQGVYKQGKIETEPTNTQVSLLDRSANKKNPYVWRWLQMKDHSRWNTLSFNLLDDNKLTTTRIGCIDVKPYDYGFGLCYQDNHVIVTNDRRAVDHYYDPSLSGLLKHRGQFSDNTHGLPSVLRSVEIYGNLVLILGVWKNEHRDRLQVWDLDTHQKLGDEQCPPGHPSGMYVNEEDNSLSILVRVVNKECYQLHTWTMRPLQNRSIINIPPPHRHVPEKKGHLFNEWEYEFHIPFLIDKSRNRLYLASKDTIESFDLPNVSYHKHAEVDLVDDRMHVQLVSISPELFAASWIPNPFILVMHKDTLQCMQKITPDLSIFDSPSYFNAIHVSPTCACFAQGKTMRTLLFTRASRS